VVLEPGLELGRELGVGDVIGFDGVERPASGYRPPTLPPPPPLPLPPLLGDIGPGLAEDEDPDGGAER